MTRDERIIKGQQRARLFVARRTAEFEGKKAEVMPRPYTPRNVNKKGPGQNRLWVASDGVHSIRVEATTEQEALALARIAPRFPKPEKLRVQEIKNVG